MKTATVVFTPGEPAGIGPDLAVKLAQQKLNCELLCIADPELLQQRAELLGETIHIRPYNPDQRGLHQPGTLSVIPVALQETATAGVLNRANTSYVLQCLDKALEYLASGTAQALVTGPVHKGIINDAGIRFSGHTEYLAERTHATPVMMLASKQMRVSLATTHLPLKDVAAAINHDNLKQTLEILHADLVNKFQIPQPNILVCGLNPHAGEDGHLGREEIDIIEPVLNELRVQGMQLQGPLPADTLFTQKYLSTADAVLAMYHDQGLPVLKHASFGEAVNITLGLPIIRTSVDHGTALPLAGTGNIDSGSLNVALQLAIELASKQLNPLS